MYMACAHIFLRLLHNDSFYFVHVNILSAFMCVHHVYVWELWRQEEALNPLYLLMDRCELPCV